MSLLTLKLSDDVGWNDSIDPTNTTEATPHVVRKAGGGDTLMFVDFNCVRLQVAANHLICASVMAAPCALAMSKLSYPETQSSKLDASGKNINEVMEAA